MSGVLVAGGAAAALLASAFSAQGVSTTSEVPSERITIGVETVNGSGCPAGTAAVAASPDNSAFTVTYSSYLAQVGVGASPTDFRKNCQLSLEIDIPQGFTYAIRSTDYRGYAHLEEGATALQKAQYYHMGSSETTASVHEFTGPYSDNWHTTDTVEVAELIWAPCGEKRNLNINSELRVDGGTSNTKKTTSFVTMDSTDSSVSTTYHLAWKECPSS